MKDNFSFLNSFSISHQNRLLKVEMPPVLPTTVITGTAVVTITNVTTAANATINTAVQLSPLPWLSLLPELLPLSPIILLFSSSMHG
jgi:hypothetical protein